MSGRSLGSDSAGCRSDPYRAFSYSRIRNGRKSLVRLPVCGEPGRMTMPSRIRADSPECVARPSCQLCRVFLRATAANRGRVIVAISMAIVKSQGIAWPKEWPYNPAMPRPKKTPANKLGLYLKIPVTPDQKRLIMEAAEMQGGEMAPWARGILTREAEGVLRTKKRERR